MRIVPVNSENREVVEAFAQRKGSLFNSLTWLNNYDEGLKHCALLNNNGDVIGCFSFYRFRKLGWSFIIPPPYSPDISLIYNNPGGSVVGRNSYDKQVTDALAAFFLEQKVSGISLQLPGAIRDSQPFIWRGFSSRHRFTYVLDLGLDENALWLNLASEKRKSINRAQKDELVTTLCKDPDEVHELIKKSLQRQGLYRHEELLKRILSACIGSDKGYAFVTRRNGEPLAASFCVIDQQRALYLFGGFDNADAHHGAGVSCLWQSILHARSIGLKQFDFEGSMHPGIERYFREFGGELQSYIAVEKVKPLLGMVLYLSGKKL